MLHPQQAAFYKNASHAKTFEMEVQEEIYESEDPPISRQEKIQRRRLFMKSKKSIWTNEEDRLLKDLVEEYGANNWGQIASQMSRRSGKQCRQRWHNHLRFGVKKGEWTLQEYWLLALGAQAFGKKWSRIANYLPGRTDNTIKNQWNCKMRPYKEEFNKKIQMLVTYPYTRASLSQVQQQLLNIIITKFSYDTETKEVNSIFNEYFDQMMQEWQNVQIFKEENLFFEEDHVKQESGDIFQEVLQKNWDENNNMNHCNSNIIEIDEFFEGNPLIEPQEPKKFLNYYDDEHEMDIESVEEYILFKDFKQLAPEINNIPFEIPEVDDESDYFMDEQYNYFQPQPFEDVFFTDD